jgi:hypothetical protein
VLRGSTTAHTRDGRERYRPDLVAALYHDRRVRVLELGGQDRTGDGQRFVRVVTAPAVMREGGARQQREGEKEDDSSRNRCLLAKCFLAP